MASNPPCPKNPKTGHGFGCGERFCFGATDFRGNGGWRGESETFFRPAFSDAVGQYTPPLLQNTIAAYLLRSVVQSGDDTILDALKNDALAKAAAAREVIDGELLKFQDAFDRRCGK